MTRGKIAGLLSLAVLGGMAGWGAGCSSSSTTPPQGIDSGAGTDSSASDTGGSPHDSSVGQDSTVRDSSSQDSSQDTSPDSGADSGDAGPACQPTSTSSFKPSITAAANEHQGVCDANAIAAFITACGFAGTPSTCGAWKAANVAPDAGPGPGTPCGNCIVAPMNNGGAWADPEGVLAPNYGACVEILEPNGGSTCAAAFDTAAGCEGVACDMACPGAAFAGCASAAGMGSCSTFAAARQIACVPLQSALTMCQPASVSGNPDDDYRFILALVCGQVGDGGTLDSGASDTGAPHDSSTATDTGG